MYVYVCMYVCIRIYICMYNYVYKTCMHVLYVYVCVCTTIMRNDIQEIKYSARQTEIS